MPAYDSAAFHPRAPVALVTLRTTPNNAVDNFPLLIDTGADVTLAPRGAVAGLVSADEDLPTYELAGFDGVQSFASAISLEMTFLGKSIRRQFPMIDSQFGILGRNVLNALSLTFDGLSLTWHENRAASATMS